VDLMASLKTFILFPHPDSLPAGRQASPEGEGLLVGF
jgi:hypothetical protein